jgi:glyoxylase-like metal-dependent hydrolase (beta-lactamase superfamily II)
MVLMLAPAVAVAQPAVERITDDLYMLSWRGGNIAVSIGDDGVVLIDDQYAQQAERNLEAIRALSDKPLRFVINTHWHGDHTGANERMAEQGALIIAHDNVRRRMSAEQVRPSLDATVPASPEAALPVVPFTEPVTLHFNGEEVHALHMPAAHTDGDAVIHFRRADVIHAGDIYFNGSFPFIDTASGGTVAGVVKAVDAMLELCGRDTRVIPGHGPLSDCDGLRGYRKMLATVRDRIAHMIAEGKSLDQIVAARPAADYAERWGGGFIPTERWVQMLYENMTQ